MTHNAENALFYLPCYWFVLHWTLTLQVYPPSEKPGWPKETHTWLYTDNWTWLWKGNTTILYTKLHRALCAVNFVKSICVLCKCEDTCQVDLTSNVLQCDGNTSRHLPRGTEGPVAELLVCTNAWITNNFQLLYLLCFTDLHMTPLWCHMFKRIFSSHDDAFHKHAGQWIFILCASTVTYMLFVELSGEWFSLYLSVSVHTYLQHQMTLAANGWNMLRGLPPVLEESWNKYKIRDMSSLILYVTSFHPSIF